MIPLLIKTKIPRQDKAPVTLYLPLFLAWPILLAILLLLLPFLVIAVVVTWPMRYKAMLIRFYPMLFAVLWNLQGLVIDVEHKDDKIYMEFI